MNSFLKGFAYFIIFAALLFSAVSAARYAKNYLTRAGASEAPQNVQIQNISQTTAQISWQTENSSQSTIVYGEQPKNLSLMVFENEAVKNHQVNVSLLNPNTNYYFKIKVGDQEFDNAGLPWQFTTLTTAGGQAGGSVQCDEQEFKQRYGTADSQYDLNQDGIVNAIDYSVCVQGE